MKGVGVLKFTDKSFFKEKQNMAAKYRAEKRRGNALVKVLLALLILALLLGAGVLFASRNYLLLDGRLYKRSDPELDLRGSEISVEKYEALRVNLPETTIYWDVPLSGGSYDQASESIALTSFTRDDLDKLSYFTNLKKVDATKAELTKEDYDLLRRALPDCQVRWSVPLSGGRFACDAEEIAVSTLAEGDLAMLDCFTALKKVDARASTDYDRIMALRDARPDLELLWQVPLSGTNYPQDATGLYVDDPSVTVADLTAALQRLPAVSSVDAPVNTWTKEEKLQLAADWPQVEFKWPVIIAGGKYTGNETELDFSGKKLSSAEIEELRANGVFLPGLRQVNLTDTGVSLEDALALKEAMPDADFIFDFELYGKTINTMDTFIDFTRTKMDSTEAVERIIPLMPKLEKIDMSWCGPDPEKDWLDNETLDAMNKRYDNVRVVWTMRIVYWTIRTDTKAFRASSRYYSYFTDETIHWFKYCPDLICMDMGHRNLTDLSFLYDVPQLEYLILLRWKATDLTPIGSLKHLKWLELNGMDYAKSLAPLKDCTSLTDLNITCMNALSTSNKVKEETYETILAMPSLERLWICNELTVDQQNKLKEARPDLMVVRVPGWEYSTLNPWRFDEDYYAMRDLLGLFYMDQGGRVNFKVIDGVRVDLDPAFIAQQGDGSMDRFRVPQE